MRFIATVVAMAALVVLAADSALAGECGQVPPTNPDPTKQCVTVDRMDDAYCAVEDQLDIVGVHADANGKSPWPTNGPIQLGKETVSGTAPGVCPQDVDYGGAILRIKADGSGGYKVSVTNSHSDPLNDAPMTVVSDIAGNDLWLTDATTKPNQRHHYVMFRNKPKGDSAPLPKYLYIEAFDPVCAAHEPNLKNTKIIAKGTCTGSHAMKDRAMGFDETGVGGGGEEAKHP